MLLTSTGRSMVDFTQSIPEMDPFGQMSTLKERGNAIYSFVEKI